MRSARRRRLLRRRRIDDVVATHSSFGVTRTKAEVFLSSLPGQHGSLTSAEQLGPLLVART